jgi:hypothetical protein
MAGFLLALTPATSTAQTTQGLNYLSPPTQSAPRADQADASDDQSNMGMAGGQHLDFDFGLTHTISNVDYSAKLKLESIPVLADVYPFARGAFRLTGGIVFNQTQFTGTGVPNASGTISINGNSYTAAQIGVLNAAIKYPSSDGYVGLGFGTPARGGPVAFTCDLGVIISKPNVALSATNPGNDAQLTSDLAAQQASTQNSVNKVSVYPVISLGLMFRM